MRARTTIEHAPGQGVSDSSERGSLANRSWADVPTLPSRRVGTWWVAILSVLFLVHASPATLAAQESAPPAPAPIEGPAAEPEQEESGTQMPVVLGIEVVGERRLDAAQIVETFGMQIGDRFDGAVSNRGVNRLWQSYGIGAQVTLEGVQEGVLVRINVTEWPFDPVPRFEGNEQVELEDLLEWVGLEPGAEIYRFQVPRIRRALLDGYKADGYYFASVEERVVHQGQGESVDVVFEIDEGPLVCVEDVVIEGNQSLPERGLLWWRSGLRALARPELRAPRFFGWFGKKFDRQVLEEDLIAFRQAYRDQGFLNAVVELDRLEFDETREWVTVHIKVDEGERFSVKSIRVQAIELVPVGTGERLSVRPKELVVPENELLELCELEPGALYSQLTIDRDEQALRDRYGELGHVADTSMPIQDRWRFLDPELVYDLDRSEVQVVYTLAEGRPQRVREVRISGNEMTRDRVLRRLVTVQPGDLADLPEIDRSLARIRGTGYFSTQFPRPGFREPYYQFFETGDPNWKDLEYVVAEGDLIQMNFAVQFSQDFGAAANIDLRFSNFDISRWPSLSNPFGDIYNGRAWRGAGQTLRLQASPGTEVSRYAISFTEPDLFQRHYDRIGSTVSFGRNLRIFRSHDERTDFASLSLFRQLDADTRGSLRFESRDVRVDDLAVAGEASLQDPLGVPDLLAEQVGETMFNSLGVGLRHDRRDRPRATKKGFVVNGQLNVFDSIFGSDDEWVELVGIFDQYGRIGREGEDWGWIFRARANTAVPYGDTEQLPYTERYFLGGNSIMRGFDFRGVGPIDDGFAEGGQTLLASSVDLRYPLVRSPIPGTLENQDVIYAGVFADAGVLGQDSFDVDLDQFRVSVGVSLGFLVPLPIALSFGFPVVEEDEDLTRTFSISFAL
ncbi:MAG: BamA/OMP85 family outer membrane protein [Planctomycetota bacterium]